MSEKRYEANIIRATAVEPANNLETTSAPGVWSIDEVVELQKKDKWPTVGNVVTDVDQVFSTFLYEGNGKAQVIDNGIALGNLGDGGSGDFTAGNTARVNVTTSSNFGFGTGDFTIEFFVYLYSQYNYSEFYDQRTSSQDSSTLSPIVYGDSSGRVYFYANGNLIQSNTNATPVGAWTHVAVTKASGSTKLFINGTQQGSTYSDSNDYLTPASSFSFGGSLEQNTYNVDGLMSNLRVVKGTAVYTSNFTAPTAALTAVSGTSLLTLQGSTPFVDNSGNSVVLTENGSPKASGFGPFTGSSGEGGLVWTKRRGDAVHHTLYDTARGATERLFSSLTNAETTETNGLTSFHSNGFSVGSAAAENNNGSEIVSWTFRKSPKFFDVVTYTGTQDGDKTISHSLNTTVGMAIIKRYDSAGYDWHVYHRSLGTSKYILLNSTNAEVSGSIVTATSNTSITLSQSNGFNTSGATYVVYLFAHNNSDGEFGPNQDQDIIKCGSFTTNSSGEIPDVDLGFEPQWILMKASGSGSSTSWFILDNMRGYAITKSVPLEPNSSNAETTSWATTTYIGAPVPTGFVQNGNNTGTNNTEWIYTAIRRGPLATPTSATDVFAVDNQSASSAPFLTSNFPVDMVIRKDTAGGNGEVMSRLLQGQAILSNSTGAEAADSVSQFDFMDGCLGSTSTDTSRYGWMFKRAPGFFDVCTYTGTGPASGANEQTITHNLGVKPEMLWIRKRSQTGNWWVFTDLIDGTNDYSYLNSTNSFNNSSNNVATSTQFSVGGILNTSSSTYVAYLFGTVAGVSKVGTYAGSSSAVNVDCGFTSGARFILIKRTSTSGDGWFLFDSKRGIVSGNDPFVYLNDTQAEFTSYDAIDPYSAGFTVTTALGGLNTNGSTYIFYAIA